MVKGISKQVIVVQSPDKKLFDQAIFILADSAVKDQGITDDMLLREAKKLIRTPQRKAHRSCALQYLLSAVSGAALTAGIWLLSAFL